MTELKIKGLPDEKPVKMIVALPPDVHRDLLAYAALLSSSDGATQKQRREAENVGTDDPFDVSETCLEVASDRWKDDRHDIRVEEPLNQSVSSTFRGYAKAVRNSITVGRSNEQLTHSRLFLWIWVNRELSDDMHTDTEPDH